MDRVVRSTLLRGLGLALVLELMLVPAIFFWPDFDEMIRERKSFRLKFMAESPLFKPVIASLLERGIDAYVITQQFFKACNIMGTAAAVLFGMGMVAGEAERGTLEIWLSRPISRARLLFERYLAGLIAICIPVFVTSASIPWLVSRIGETVEMQSLMLSSIHQCIFLMAIFSITFLLSSFGSSPIRIAIAMLFGSIFMFAMYLVKSVTYYSMLRLSDLDTYLYIFDHDNLPWAKAVPMLVMIAVCLWGSLFAFRRRVP